jgi:hypothetical protein
MKGCWIQDAQLDKPTLIWHLHRKRFKRKQEKRKDKKMIATLGRDGLQAGKDRKKAESSRQRTEKVQQKELGGKMTEGPQPGPFVQEEADQIKHQSMLESFRAQDTLARSALIHQCPASGVMQFNKQLERWSKTAIVMSFHDCRSKEETYFLEVIHQHLKKIICCHAKKIRDLLAYCMENGLHAVPESGRIAIRRGTMQEFDQLEAQNFPPMSSFISIKSIAMQLMFESERWALDSVSQSKSGCQSISGKTSADVDFVEGYVRNQGPVQQWREMQPNTHGLPHFGAQQGFSNTLTQPWMMGSHPFGASQFNLYSGGLFSAPSLQIDQPQPLPRGQIPSILSAPPK